MKNLKSLDFILAGGGGQRLYPITRDRAKPAAPFGAKYRIIDLALNNHANSGSKNIVVVAQYKPASLKRHISHAWQPEFERQSNEFIRVVEPPHGEYHGTADAVYQNMGLAEADRPKLVSIFCGDHIYLMDTSQMKQYHLDSGADLTIAAIPLKKEIAAGKFGVMEVNKNNEVIGFEEKPPNPASMPGNDGYCLASMGNYVFDCRFLKNALIADQKKERVLGDNRELVGRNQNIYTLNDFGFNVIPQAIRDGKRIMLYDFRGNKPDEIPVVGYWRDVGTLDQFIEANMDLVGHAPNFVVDNSGWPIITFDEAHGKPIKGAEFAVDSALANGVHLANCLVERCVVSYNTSVGKKSEISDSILMGGSQIGQNVRLRKVVIDRGVHVPDNTRIGVLKDEDSARGFVFSPSGYVIVPRNYQFK